MTDGNAQGVPVWDPLVRVVHWSQAALIAAAWLTADDWKWLHERIGYTIAALLTVRVVWGFVGPRHARFSDFVRGPRVVLGYLQALGRGRGPRMLGHNPAGGAMIVALLVTIAATAFTGWLQTTDAYWGSTWLENLHEALATAILVLVPGHLLGVVFESWRHRENLVGSMLTGRKQPLAEDQTTAGAG